MLKPLQLAHKAFPINIIQGPLAGISCAPFRLLTWRYSQPAYSCTEMISCKTLLHKSEFAQRRFLVKDPQEGPVCYQLASNDPTEVAEATKIVTQYGADLIDLNCGCPVKKIRSKGAGSGLLTDPVTLYQLIRALKQSTHIPVAIKIRVEGNSHDKFNQEIAKVVSEGGADFLIVHGRHWTEHYETPCRHEQIQFFVDQLKIPVIGNGDIFDLDSLKKMLATGCAGVMLARAGVGQPWLIRKLIAQFNQQEFKEPTFGEIGSIFVEHISRLSELLRNEKASVLQARKLAKYYARHNPNKIEFCNAINQCVNLDDFTAICQQFFNSHNA